MSVIERERVTTTTTRDVLVRAADILEEFDWRQGSPGSRDEGSMCAVGAIFEALSDFGVGLADRLARSACIAFGEPASPCGVLPIAKWNDEPQRTKAEVVACLRALADGVA